MIWSMAVYSSLYSNKYIPEILKICFSCYFFPVVMDQVVVAGVNVMLVTQAMELTAQVSGYFYCYNSFLVQVKF